MNNRRRSPALALLATPTATATAGAHETTNAPRVSAVRGPAGA
jgi:hypothetical protein